MNKSKKFNPDSFELQKEDIKIIIQAIEKRWSGDFLKNGKYLIVIKAMKAGLMLASEDVVVTIWKDIIKCVNAMMELNDMNILSSDEDFKKGRNNIKLMRDNLIKKIQNGELF